MGGDPQGEVTRLLQAIDAGDSKSSEELLPLVYDELRRLAAAQMRHEKPGQTLQPTALVHEAYLRLVGGQAPNWKSRAHFFGAAAQAMRRLLVEQARRRGRIKRGGELGHVPLSDEFEGKTNAENLDLVVLDEALRRMEQEDERMARVVMLRFFAGLSVEETAEAMDISPMTVKREWAVAKAWLFDELHAE